MIYNIIYDAVKKKTKTNPPNEFIGNVEMAAGIGIVIDECKITLDFSNITEPEMLKKEFLEKVVRDNLSEMGRIIVDLVERYQVKTMVNETMEDLKILAGNYPDYKI